MARVRTFARINSWTENSEDCRTFHLPTAQRLPLLDRLPRTDDDADGGGRDWSRNTGQMDCVGGTFPMQLLRPRLPGLREMVWDDGVARS